MKEGGLFCLWPLHIPLTINQLSTKFPYAKVIWGGTKEMYLHLDVFLEKLRPKIIYLEYHRSFTAEQNKFLGYD